jgi:hypothetical protein
MSDLDVIIEKMAELAETNEKTAAQCREMLVELVGLRARLGASAQQQYIRPDGKLSEAGVRFCDDSFAKALGPSEIANQLGISVPAVVKRRQRWVAGQKTNAGAGSQS